MSQVKDYQVEAAVLALWNDTHTPTYGQMRKALEAAYAAKEPEPEIPVSKEMRTAGLYAWFDSPSETINAGCWHTKEAKRKIENVYRAMRKLEPAPQGAAQPKEVWAYCSYLGRSRRITIMAPLDSCDTPHERSGKDRRHERRQCGAVCGVVYYTVCESGGINYIPCQRKSQRRSASTGEK